MKWETHRRVAEIVRETVKATLHIELDEQALLEGAVAPDKEGNPLKHLPHRLCENGDCLYTILWWGSPNICQTRRILGETVKRCWREYWINPKGQASSTCSYQLGQAIHLITDFATLCHYRGVKGDLSWHMEYEQTIEEATKDRPIIWSHEGEILWRNSNYQTVTHLIEQNVRNHIKMKGSIWQGDKRVESLPLDDFEAAVTVSSAAALYIFSGKYSPLGWDIWEIGRTLGWSALVAASVGVLSLQTSILALAGLIWFSSMMAKSVQGRMGFDY